MRKIYKINGFTLIEMLIVTAIFSGLAILVSSMVLYSTRGAKKSESAVKVRAELENAIARVERSLREAKAGTVTAGTNSISFKNQDDVSVNIVCNGSSPNIKLVMNGQDLTGSNIGLTACSFSFSSGTVSINLTGKSVGISGVETDQVTVSSKVVLRNY